MFILPLAHLPRRSEKHGLCKIGGRCGGVGGGQTRCIKQRAKEVVSDSPGLVDFAFGLVNSVLNLPDGQVKILKTKNVLNT